MEIKRTMKMEIEKSQIKKGDRRLISGEEWKVLAQAGNKALLWKCTNVFTSMFDKAGETDYLKSNIRRFLKETYPKMVPKGLREAITEDGFFFLTKGEIEVYMPNEANRIAVDEYGQTTWYWTASSYSRDPDYVHYVCSDGQILYCQPDNHVGVAPACWVRF